MIPYQEIDRPEIELPDRQQKGYIRPPIEDITWVPEVYPQPEQIKNKNWGDRNYGEEPKQCKQISACKAGLSS